MRVLIHAQHLTGVGHRVRALELARALARRHEVFVVDGGPPLPRPNAGEPWQTVALPRLVRGRGGVRSFGDERPVERVLAERRSRLRSEAARLAPDVLLVEHHPFSKWELEGEILGAIEALREARPDARVVCSVRDVCRQTRHEAVPKAAYAERVLASLEAHFDAVLVHADPQFTRLEAHFPEAHRIAVPVHHTGFVSEKAASDRAAPQHAERPYAVLSVGGGAGSRDLVGRCIEAWQRLGADGRLGGRRLVVFPGLYATDGELAGIRRAAAGGPVEVRRFASDFLSWLAAADLSISRAGYNTCTNLLETHCPSLLLPDPRMSDQPWRAARMRELGLAECLDSDGSTLETLARAIASALGGPCPQHRLDLGGAAETRRRLEALVAGSSYASLLGPDLLALTSERGERLTGCAEVTALPPPSRSRAAFSLEFADGTRLKGRRVKSPAQAERVERLLLSLGEGFPRILARRGSGMLLEWVEGAPLDRITPLPAGLMVRCGELLGTLHRAPAQRPGPGVETLLARLVDEIEELCAAGLLEPEEARRIRSASEEAHPDSVSQGIVHRDFCASNLVLRAGATPVSIDNASLSEGPQDLDLARTWQRWPMTRSERLEFAEGYEKHRSLTAFLRHFGFWAAVVLAHAAVKRLRMGAPGVDEGIARLKALGRGVACDERDVGHPFWGP